MQLSMFEGSVYPDTDILACQRCRLCATRTRVVPGEGDPRARVFFVGEAPGKAEDLEGTPFIGRAGRVLDQSFEVLGLKREEVFITNVLKCRPPGNRDPQEDEVQACLPWLVRQLETARPKVVVTLGVHALKVFSSARLGEAIGKAVIFDGRLVSPLSFEPKIVALYHPAALLYDPGKRRIHDAALIALKEIIVTEGIHCA